MKGEKIERKNRKLDRKKKKLDKFEKAVEEIGIKLLKCMNEKQNKMRKGNDIFVKRMMYVKFDVNEKGECNNVCNGKKRPIVKAGDDICSVGMIRKGRNWGDYGAVFCCECPYFIPRVRERMALEMNK